MNIYHVCYLDDEGSIEARYFTNSEDATQFAKGKQGVSIDCITCDPSWSKAKLICAILNGDTRSWRVTIREIA
jgi:hypothetical protein